MHTTSPSLLLQLRQPGQTNAWSRFVALYTPLLYYWARRLKLRDPEAADLVQEVLTTLVQKLPEFSYDPKASFRSWLRTVTLNKWRDLCRRQEQLPRATQDSSDLTITVPDNTLALEEAEYRQYLVGRALRLMQTDFQPTTWKACWECVVAGKSAAEVARELGMSVGAVRIAKSRVLHQLRQELDGLMD
jgi:RNA polymerase sigma-70 factor (ECF subfamily)